jgi:hypothetical protein
MPSDIGIMEEASSVVCSYVDIPEWLEALANVI